MFKPLFKTRAQIELSIMESEANGENIIRTKIKRSILALGPQKRVSGYDRNKAEKWVGIIAPLMAIFFFGLFAGPIGFSHISRNKKTKKWPFVKGSVIRSFLNSKRIARRFRGGAVYVPEITYVYKVDNMEYKNNTIYFFKGHSNIYNIEATYVEKY